MLSVDESGLPLGEAAARFWDESARHEAAAGSVRIRLRRLVEGLGSATAIEDISGDALSRYVRRQRNVISHHGKPFSARSVNFDVVLLRRLMNRAQDAWGATLPSVDWQAVLLSEPRKKRWILSAAEEERLLAEAPGHLHGPIRLALLTGMHLKSAVGLRWEQVDLGTGTLSLRGYHGSTYTLPITPKVRAIVESQRGSDGHVFTYRRIGLDLPEPIKYWHHAWLAACKRAGLEGLRAWDLRHTVAARLIARGVDVSVVQRVLGHRYIYTTAQYLKYEMAEKSDALGRLAQ